MYPDADVPVCQISIQPGRGPAYHLRLGAALRSLRDDGVMVIGSGCATHNLTELHTRGYAHDTDAPQWVIAFSEWVHDNVEAGDIDALLNYRELAPYAVDNHPTQEHFMPLFVAAGAGAEPKGTLVHASHTYGVLAMDAYRFD
jgi:4,5-DOPA dioxygenase extradiol